MTTFTFYESEKEIPISILTVRQIHVELEAIIFCYIYIYKMGNFINTGTTTTKNLFTEIFKVQQELNRLVPIVVNRKKKKNGTSDQTTLK